MNRIDRQNLAAMTSSLTHNEPMGLNTETGMPQTGSGQAFAEVADMSVPNGGRIIDPKPGSKFAAPEEDDFGTMPVSMNSHGDIVGTEPAPRPSAGRGSYSVPDNVIAPKPGSKFAVPEEDFGTIPVSMNSHGDIVSTEPAPRPSAGRGSYSVPDNVIAPKPGSKFAVPTKRFV